MEEIDEVWKEISQIQSQFTRRTELLHALEAVKHELISSVGFLVTEQRSELTALLSELKGHITAAGDRAELELNAAKAETLSSVRSFRDELEKRDNGKRSSSSPPKKLMHRDRRTSGRRPHHECSTEKVHYFSSKQRRNRSSSEGSNRTRPPCSSSSTSCEDEHDPNDESKCDDGEDGNTGYYQDDAYELELSSDSDSEMASSSSASSSDESWLDRHSAPQCSPRSRSWRHSGRDSDRYSSDSPREMYRCGSPGHRSPRYHDPLSSRSSQKSVSFHGPCPSFSSHHSPRFYPMLPSRVRKEYVPRPSKRNRRALDLMSGLLPHIAAAQPLPPPPLPPSPMPPPPATNIIVHMPESYSRDEVVRMPNAAGIRQPGGDGKPTPRRKAGSSSSRHRHHRHKSKHKTKKKKKSNKKKMKAQSHSSPFTEDALVRVSTPPIGFFYMSPQRGASGRPVGLNSLSHGHLRY